MGKFLFWISLLIFSILILSGIGWLFLTAVNIIIPNTVDITFFKCLIMAIVVRVLVLMFRGE